MRSQIVLAQLALVLSLSATAAFADDLGPSYDLSWNTVDCGGDVSTGANYQITGTVGQPDAGQVVLTGGTYILAGGFWPGVTQSCLADISGDGLVNIDDLAVVITSWGNCPP